MFAELLIFLSHTWVLAKTFVFVFLREGSEGESMDLGRSSRFLWLDTRQWIKNCVWSRDARKGNNMILDVLDHLHLHFCCRSG